MLPFFLIISLVLLNLGLNVLLMVRDKRYIQHALQSHGARHIHLHYRWLESRPTRRLYDVTYLSATSQPCSAAWVSVGYGLFGPSIYQLKGASSLYRLLPTRKRDNVG